MKPKSDPNSKISNNTMNTFNKVVNGCCCDKAKAAQKLRRK